jgi:anti-anti-sigma factor
VHPTRWLVSGRGRRSAARRREDRHQLVRTASCRPVGAGHDLARLQVGVDQPRLRTQTGREGLQVAPGREQQHQGDGGQHDDRHEQRGEQPVQAAASERGRRAGSGRRRRSRRLTVTVVVHVLSPLVGRVPFRAIRPRSGGHPATVCAHRRPGTETMQFHVDRVQRPRDVVLSVHGELDIATITDLRGAVQEVLDDLGPTVTAPSLYLDLTPTTFIDSTGCRELVRAVKTAAPRGVVVELVAPQGNRKVRRIIDFMQFGALLPVLEELPAP